MDGSTFSRKWGGLFLVGLAVGLFELSIQYKRQRGSPSPEERGILVIERLLRD